MDARDAQRDAIGTARGLALLGLFLGSGATSLVYQILWVRELSLALGSTVYAISIVVSAFMGGLALGSVWLGRRVERARSGLALYAWLEAGIGLCALLLPWVFTEILSLAAQLPVDTAPGRALPFAASFLALLVPTTLMGGTLPVLARYVAGFDTRRGVSIGLLYSLNTAGAVLGTAVTGLVLVRWLGIQSTTYLAAAGNLAICALGLLMARRWPQGPSEFGGPAPETPRAGDGALLAPVALVYCVNGFAGLALQLLWTRAFGLFGTNTTYAFTLILIVYLCGLGLGSSVASSLLPRLRSVAVWLAVLQSLIAVVAALTPLGMAAFGLEWFAAIETRLGSTGLGRQVLAPSGLAALLMLPATLLLGACFPLVAEVAAGQGAGVGRRVGAVYALNTLGGVAGSLLAGFVLLPLLGIERSILVCAALLAASGGFLAWRCGSRAPQVLAAGGLALCLLLGAFASQHFRGMLESRLGHELLFYREGVETTVGVFDSPRAGRPVLVINNVALADTGVVHKLLSHLPALLHPDPQRALVLGFGVGISSQSLAAHGIRENHCVEISPGVIEAAPHFRTLNADIVGRGDPAFRLFVADGRKLLLSPGDPYDIVVLDANSGSMRNAGVGKLYTREFFEVVKQRLSPKGIISLYIPLDSTHAEYQLVVRTFLDVFPYAGLFLDRAFGETSVVLGSLEPLRANVPRYLERVLRPDVQADLAPLRLDEPGVLLASFLAGEELLRGFAGDGPRNTDDHPLLEFFGLDEGPFAQNDRAFADSGLWLHRESPLGLLEGVSEHPRGSQLRAFLGRDERASYPLFEAGIHQWWGDVAGQRAALQRAASLHPEARYLSVRAPGFPRDEALLALREAESALAKGPSGDPALLRSVAERAWRAGDYGRSLDAHAALGAIAEARDHLAHARVLERLGDPVGAHAYYAAVLEADASLRGAQAGRERTRRLAALRMSALQNSSDARLPRSPFTPRPPRPEDWPVLDHRDPQAWLELSKLHLATRRPIMAYRMARAARTLGPKLPESYLAVGTAAERLPFPGTRELARVAYLRALELDADFAPAVEALAALEP